MKNPTNHINPEMYVAGILSDVKEMLKRGQTSEASVALDEAKQIMLKLAELRHLEMVGGAK